MKMKTFYLHAGIYKTGSTALQFFCFGNRDRLKENNLYYINTGRIPFRENHWGLFPLKSERWEELAEEVKEYGQGDLLCSCEGMFPQMLSSGDINREFQKILSYLPEYKIKVIMYIRRLDDFLKALYNQYTKGIFFLAKKEFQFNDIDNIFILNKDFLKYETFVNIHIHLLQRFVDEVIPLFNDDNFIIKIYDRKLLKNGNIIDDFFNAIGIDISDIPQDGLYTNEKIPDVSLPLLQTLYSSGIPWESESANSIREKILRLYSLSQGSDAGKFVNQAEIDSLIERLDSLCPGYKALFADRKCDFSFPEIDFDPKDRLLFDLLFSMYAQQHDLHARQHGLCESLPRLENEIHSPSFKNGIVSAITDSEAYTTSLKNAMISVLYPNFLQRLVLQVFRLFYRLTRKREVYHHFRHRNVDFISRPDRYPSKILRQILRIFGPIPPIQR